jgi:GDSL-like Lipase/Acylhydrolase family
LRGDERLNGRMQVRDKAKAVAREAAALLWRVARWWLRRLPHLGRGVLAWLPAIAIGLICVEILLQTTVRLGFAPLDLPSYSLEEAAPFWQDINPDFGVWHQPHARYRHQKSCFDLIYTSNAHGMRDGEVDVASAAPRVVMLGDSFVEGWGVADGQRFTNRLTGATGIPHLNFGVAGDFGPTQESILYRTLASKFEHDAVILTILPANDFLDDEPWAVRLRKNARYRPYLVGEYPDYTVKYPAGGFKPVQHRGWQFKNALREFWLTYRTFDHFTQFAQQLITFYRRRGSFDPLQSYYFDYTNEEFGRMRYAIEQIRAAAGDRPMLVVTVPTGQDYDRAQAEGGTPPLTRDLRWLAQRTGFTYMDLREYMDGSERKRQFLACDPHWSPIGHAQAAAAIANWEFYQR